MTEKDLGAPAARTLDEAKKVIEILFANGSAMAETIEMLRARVRSLSAGEGNNAALGPGALPLATSVAPAGPDTGHPAKPRAAPANPSDRSPMPLPLKPGEEPELAWLVVNGGSFGIYTSHPSWDGILRALKAYGDRRGEEERAKALEDAIAAVEDAADYGDRVPTLTAAIRSLAAAPSGDARRHWADCAMNHGGAECDMGPDCGAPSGDAKGK